MGELPEVCHNPDRRSSGNRGLLDANSRHALTAWTRAKQNLRQVMRPEDFRAFVNPMRLLAVLSGSHLLIALPHNRRVMERARNFRPNLAAFIQQQGYELAGLAPYPSDDHLGELARHESFAPFIRIIARTRVEKARRRFVREDARDSMPLGAA
jgi:hypothetical protein